MKRVDAVIDQVFGQMEAAADARLEVTGVPTGFNDLDRLTAGLQPGDLFLLAGPTSSGKSAMALGIAYYAASKAGRRVLHVDCFAHADRVVRRLLAAESRTDAWRLQTARLDDQEWLELGDALGTLAKADLHLIAGPEASLDTVVEAAKEFDSLDLLIVDGLGMLAQSVLDDGGTDRWDAATTVVNRLKGLALSLRIPVILTAGVKTAHLSRTDKRPMLHEVAETFAASAVADLVGFIYRDEMYDEDTPDKGIAELIIAKNRDGPSAVVKLAFINHLVTFANLARKGPSPPV